MTLRQFYSFDLQPDVQTDTARAQRCRKRQPADFAGWRSEGYIKKTALHAEPSFYQDTVL